MSSGVTTIRRRLDANRPLPDPPPTPPPPKKKKKVKEDQGSQALRCESKYRVSQVFSVVKTNSRASSVVRDLGSHLRTNKEIKHNHNYYHIIIRCFLSCLFYLFSFNFLFSYHLLVFRCLFLSPLCAIYPSLSLFFLSFSLVCLSSRFSLFFILILCKVLP